MGNDTATPYFGLKLRLILLLLITAICAFTGGLLSAPYMIPIRESISASLGASSALEGEAGDEVYEKILPSVVGVRGIGGGASPVVEAGTELPATPESLLPDTPGRGQGAGFVWDKAGYIVTNLHVVEGAQCIEVTFADGTEVGAALHGVDLSTDLAVLKVNLPPERLQPVTLGDSATLKTGQPALAMGAPPGQDFTMTGGSIDALDQTMQGCDSCYPIADVIRTDMLLIPEHSGSPLLNEQGEVIGMNTWIISRNSGNSGISFAISSRAMAQVVPTLIENQQ
jgi:S1-C subfamily serine protease